MQKIIISALLVVVISCASLDFTINTSYNKFDKVYIHHGDNNYLNEEIQASVELNPTMFVKESGEVMCFLILELRTPEKEWLSFNQSLEMCIDGQVKKMKDITQNRKRSAYKDGWYGVKAYYKIEKQDMECIARAREVSIQILFEKFSVPAYFSQANIDNYRNFMLKSLRS